MKNIKKNQKTNPIKIVPDLKNQNKVLKKLLKEIKKGNTSNLKNI